MKKVAFALLFFKTQLIIQFKPSVLNLDENTLQGKNSTTHKFKLLVHVVFKQIQILLTSSSDYVKIIQIKSNVKITSFKVN